MITNLTQAQSDMRSGYCSGGAGILASALAWLAAAIATLQAAPQQAVWVLFIGGMAIHPFGIVICRLLGGSGKHAKDNPLGSLAWAGTLWLMFSLPLAYAVSLYRIEWFFPAMLLLIGGRYLTFSMLFGMRVYWLLGLSLAAAGCLPASHSQRLQSVPLSGPPLRHYLPSLFWSSTGAGCALSIYSSARQCERPPCKPTL